MKRYLQCAEQQESASNFSKYCACHAKWLSWLILVTHETHFTMRRATSVIVQTHQILHLPRKMTLMINPLHTWNAIYNARSNMSLSKLTKYCACHEKRISWLILVTHETLFTMRGATSVIVQTHQILRLPRKMTLQNFAKISRKQLKRHFQCGADPSRIRAGSENDPRMKPSLRNPPRNRGYFSTSILYWKIQHFALRLSFQISPNTAPATKSDTSTSPNTAPATQNDSHHQSSSHMKRYLQCAEQQVSLSKLTKYCACHAKWLSWSILFTHETLFTMRGATSVIVQTHQILRLPRKMNLMIDPCHTCNAIYNARSNKCHCPNSPNTAPATKNESHDWSLSHMKRYLQCAEQQVSLSKLTKYCACHAKWLSKISQKFLENSWNVISNAGDPSRIRAGSKQDPSMKPSLRNPPRNRGYFSRPTRAFCIEKYNITRSGYHSKFHRILRLPRKVTLQLHQILRLPRKVTLERHQIVHLPRKVTLELQQIEPLLDWAMTSLSYYLTELLLDWAITWLSYCLTWAMTWLSYYLTELLLDWAITWHELWLDWAMTWLSYDLTELWLDWATTWLSYYLTELLLDWAMTWLSYYLTELLLDLSYDLTELLLDWAITWLSYYLTWVMTWLSYDLTELWLDWAMTWLSYDLTELLLDWAIAWLSYDLTELLLDWAITWLSYYMTWAMTWLSYDLTELLLDWAMTWLSYYLTELLLDWAITWLSYYLTELLLDWAIAWLELWLDWAITWLSYYLTELLLDMSYDLTELWLDWAMTWLSYDLTELLLDWAMTWLSYGCDLIRISEVSQLNFLWLDSDYKFICDNYMIQYIYTIHYYSYSMVDIRAVSMLE